MNDTEIFNCLTDTSLKSVGSVVQCSARDLKIANLILVRDVALSLTLAELYGL